VPTAMEASYVQFDDIYHIMPGGVLASLPTCGNSC
jgi:hypothetical protein